MASPRSTIKLAALSGMMLMMMMSAAYAMQYKVGGDAGWVAGDDLQAWVSHYTFYVGDELYFHYEHSQSSVVLVTEEAYKDCDIDKEVASDGGQGDMVMTLLTPETYYFISGDVEQCKEGLRLEVPVLDTPAASGGVQPGVTTSPSSSDNTNIPSRSFNTPYSSFRPNSSSPSSLATTSTILSLALALAFSYLLTL